MHRKQQQQQQLTANLLFINDMSVTVAEGINASTSYSLLVVQQNTGKGFPGCDSFFVFFV